MSILGWFKSALNIIRDQLPQHFQRARERNPELALESLIRVA